MDNSTWEATVGAGTKLGVLDEKLHDAGGRAVAHGICPGVGLGGHATIGGLGPPSRMWGATLDHVVEVEVVTADGEIVKASENENMDLFWVSALSQFMLPLCLGGYKGGKGKGEWEIGKQW